MSGFRNGADAAGRGAKPAYNLVLRLIFLILNANRLVNVVIAGLTLEET